MNFEVNILVDKEEAGTIPLEFPGDAPRNFQNPFAVPYRAVLCLDGLLKHVEQYLEGADAGARLLARAVTDYVESYPELRGPIEDTSLLDDHQDLLDMLLLFLLPAGERETSLYKISVPFRMAPDVISPALRTLLTQKSACYSFGEMMSKATRRHLVSVGCTILHHCYGIDVNSTPRPILSVPNPDTGLVRFYRPSISDDFVEVVPIGDLPELSGDDIHRLLNNLDDADLWLRLLPADKFAFHGFHFSQLYEVTRTESMSRLKHRLISRDAVLDVDRVRDLADLIRIYFQRTDLNLGLTAVDYPVDRAVDHEYRIRFNLLADRYPRLTHEDFAGSIYERVFKSQQLLLVEDLTALTNRTPLENALLESGVGSILLAPLLSQAGHIIGLVELASPTPYGISAFMQSDFEEIRALFRTAVERSREYVDNRIEAIVREQYTSLHPSIEWRFTKAAYDILERVEAGEENVQAEKITFRDVYPLYAQADIVGSSSLRNFAIYQDLIDNLKAGRFFLVRALDLVSFPLVSQVVMSLDELVAIRVEDFDNSHEAAITGFIHEQLTPLIRELGQHPDLKELAADYEEQLDDELRLFYRIRRDYETSVSTLNRNLSEFLNERNAQAQEVLPHYFEMYKTDGVEYEIYAGQSLLRNQTFSPIHLRNLRLAQLIDLAELTRKVAQLSETLPLPLRTAQLVFAYTTQIDISFRMDEKRFDVEGDYNVRYEILKKRIDKATVNGGRERLTQKGTISIVYLQDKDRWEYEDYLHYLRQAGYVDGEIEYLTLDALQAVNGLRALRFRVKA